MAKTQIPTLKADVRGEKGSSASRRIRNKGSLPAVLYGHKEESIALTVDHREVETMLKHGTLLVELDIDGKAEQALIKAIQHDHAGYGMLHVDFERVSMDELVTVTVALDFHGTPAGATHGGIVEYQLTEITVECLPMDIPEVIRVDIAHLEIGDSIHARDVVPPEGVKVARDPEDMVVAVAAPRGVEEEAEEEAEKAGITEPEVIGAKKEQEEKAEE
jgi:large subunit ribosomal protein L25